MNTYLDWGEVSDLYDDIKVKTEGKDLASENEAQTRFDVIDRFIREILQWHYGQISVEELSQGEKTGYVDYLLKSKDYRIIIEAKKIGASFPSFSKKKKLKLMGSILNQGEISEAIKQAERYALEKDANVVVVTNGACWCFFKFDPEEDRGNIYATILHPFEEVADAESLFKIFSIQNVDNGSLKLITNDNPFPGVYNLISSIQDGDARIGRNNIADFISPALDYAFHGDSLIGDVSKLRSCFVTTDARTKYDSTLKIFLGDKKPTNILPARVIRKDKAKDELKESFSNVSSNTINPLTLLIGPVGAGKSTYLSHFELIHAKDLIESKSCFWINIDFEKMGALGNPRQFIYKTLLDYTLQNYEHIQTDFQGLIKPAYETEINYLKRGPYSLLSKNQEKFDEKIQEKIAKDFDEVEPYVEKLFRYISTHYICVIVLDNIDLYENPDLEVKVFSEGIAFAKKIRCNIIMSIRETTFVNHKNDSIFNAYDLKKFWIDPPPFREVLAKRLRFAGLAIKGKKATIPYSGMNLTIEDLSVFFEIANKTLLQELAAKFIESIADGNIRKGINLVSNFLTSGHIQADRALYNYLNKEVLRNLPFHEVFKGATLGQWKYYKEERAELINILNSGYNSKTIQLLRVYILKFLFERARDKNTYETSIKYLYETFSHLGASETHINESIAFMVKNGLIRTTDSLEISNSSVIFITASGSYYYSFLFKKFEYLETIIYDTPIYDRQSWEKILECSQEIDFQTNILARLEIRAERMKIFYQYLRNTENEILNNTPIQYMAVISQIEKPLLRQAQIIQRNAKIYYSKPLSRNNKGI